MKLALTLPGFSPIPQPSGLKPEFTNNTANLASILTPLLNIIFFLAAFVSFYYVIWGAYSYITAQGKKEDLAKARARITWAIIGLIVVLLAFSFSQFIANKFMPQGGIPF